MKGVNRRQARRKKWLSHPLAKKLDAQYTEDRGITSREGGDALNTKDTEESGTMSEEEEDAFVDAVETCDMSISNSVHEGVSKDAKKYMVELSEPFYLNIIVVDGSAAVESEVQDKVGSGFFGFAASAIAKSVVTDYEIAKKVATQLVDMIPPAMKDMGITLQLEKKFQMGSFIVLRGSIQEVSLVDLVTLGKGEEFGAKFARMLDCFEALKMSEAKEQVRLQVKEQINDKLLEKIEEIVPEKLREAGIATRVIGKSVEEQADFFFDFISNIQD